MGYSYGYEVWKAESSMKAGGGYIMSEAERIIAEIVKCRIMY